MALAPHQPQFVVGSLAPDDQIVHFIKEYIISQDAKAAAIKAGVPLARAKRQGEKWLNDPRVIAHKQRIQAERDRRLSITADRLDYEAWCLASVDPASAYDDEGNPLKMHEIPERTRRAITGKNRSGDWVFHDKLAAIRTLMQRRGLLDTNQNRAFDWDNIVRSCKTPDEYKAIEAVLTRALEQANP